MCVGGGGRGDGTQAGRTIECYLDHFSPSQKALETKGTPSLFPTSTLAKISLSLLSSGSHYQCISGCILASLMPSPSSFVVFLLLLFPPGPPTPSHRCEIKSIPSPCIYQTLGKTFGLHGPVTAHICMQCCPGVMVFHCFSYYY